MDYYAGLDVSMKETCVCIVDEKGNRILEQKLDTDPKSIANFLLSHNLPT